jgi:glycosyltransferase involved in cell wall biosynthesis
MTRPTKVLHVLNGPTGGAALSTLALIASLEKTGVRSCAICHDQGTAIDREKLSNAGHGEVQFTQLYWWNKKIRWPRLLRPVAELRQGLRTGWTHVSGKRVTDAARRWGADLVHTNTMLTPEGWMAAGALGLPHVWHVRELIGTDKPFRFAVEGKALGEYIATRASKVIANSNATAAQIRGILPAGVLEIVPNGIDISQFQPTVKASSGKLVVAMVAGMTARWKKHNVFVKAAVQVDPSLPVEFRIYGQDPSNGGTRSGGAYVDELHEIIRAAGAEKRFTWPGYVADPRKVMAEIDILAHSTDHESFGRVIVEGMAASLPVVGANGGGVGEIVVDGETGILFPPDDHVAMARAIEALARDPVRRTALGAAGRKRALEKYSLESCASGVLAVYEQAMARPLRASSFTRWHPVLSALHR